MAGDAVLWPAGWEFVRACLTAPDEVNTQVTAENPNHRELLISTYAFRNDEN